MVNAYSELLVLSDEREAYIANTIFVLITISLVFCSGRNKLTQPDQQTCRRQIESKMNEDNNL